MNNRAKLRQRINKTRKILKGREAHMNIEEIIDHSTLLAEYAFELGRNEAYQEELARRGLISHYEKPREAKDEG